MVRKVWVVAISLSALILGILGGMMMWRPEKGRYSRLLDEARLSRREGLTTEATRQVHFEIYETSRTTPVYKEPSVSSQKVATIPQGTKVTVVGSKGEWLQVRSRHGNPPGFIHRSDVVLAETSI